MNAIAIPIYAAALTDIGGRKTNEDAIYICNNIEAQQLETRGHLYIVADGTGGQEGGQTASAMAAAIIGERFYDDNTSDIEFSLRSAVQTAHEALHELSVKVATWARMSTTIVAAVVQGGNLYVAYVGDSRAYLIRDGQARLLTRDHVWLEDDENYGSLMRWLGGGRATVAVDIVKMSLREGDKVLLCSDGLTNVADREDLQDIVAKLSPQVAAENLIEMANRRGTSDNISVCVIQYGGQAPKVKRPVWLLTLVGFLLLVFVLGAGLLFALGDSGPRNNAGVVDSSATPTLVRQIEGITSATATATPTPAEMAPINDSREPTSTPRPETPTPTSLPTSIPFTPIPEVPSEPPPTPSDEVTIPGPSPQPSDPPSPEPTSPHARP